MYNTLLLPKAPFLIEQSNILSPSFHKVISPGISYTGGKTFFIDNPWLIINIPDREVYHPKKNPLEEIPDSLVDALIYYFIGSSIQVNFKKELDFSSMMVHPAVENDSTEMFYIWINSTINHWLSILLDNNGVEENEKKEVLINNYIKPIFEKSTEQLDEEFDFDLVINEIIEVIKDTKITRVIKNLGSEINWESSASHILIGGPKLDRGYTVKNLLVTYMPRRNIGRSTADTIQQRCRFFGYRKKNIS